MKNQKFCALSYPIILKIIVEYNIINWKAFVRNMSSQTLRIFNLFAYSVENVRTRLMVGLEFNLSLHSVILLLSCVSQLSQIIVVTK